MLWRDIGVTLEAIVGPTYRFLSLLLVAVPTLAGVQVPKQP